MLSADTDSTASPSRQRCTVAALALVLVAAFVGLALTDRADRAAAAARDRVAVVERAAAAVRAAFDQDGLLLDRLASDAATAELHDMLALVGTLMPGMGGAEVVGDDGAPVARTPDRLSEATLAALAAEAQLALMADGAPVSVVTGPVRDAALGLDMIGLARLRHGGDGAPAGLALVAIDADWLGPRETLPAGSSLMVRHVDGPALLQLGDPADDPSNAASVPGYPLEITYARPMASVWRDWWTTWLRNGIAVGGIGLMVALAAALIDRRRRRHAARAAEARAREAFALRRDVADLSAKASRADEASRAKSRFFAQVTHELRTPLNAIIGFSETIRDEIFGPVANPRYREYARLIHDAGSHLLSLINDLLDAAKLEEGKMEIAPIRVSAAALARATLDIVELLARERGVLLTVSGVDSCPDLTVDPRAAKQVLVNLLSNAIKFTPPGGHIEFAFVGRPDGSVAVAVSDSGIGMSAEALRLAFEPFGRAAGESGSGAPGTGLGLPIARALVRLHGGDLSLSSVSGRGTTATAVFPADAGASRPADAPAPARAA